MVFFVFFSFFFVVVVCLFVFLLFNNKSAKTQSEKLLAPEKYHLFMVLIHIENNLSI